MKLTMVGTGYVGLVTGACLASTGNEVTCLDIDKKKIATLRAGESPIYEPGLKDLIARNTEAGRLHFTTDPDEAYRHADAIFICVGTPSDEDGAADLRGVFAVAEDIAKAIDRHRSAKPRLIVVKSTVPVGTTQRVKELIADLTGAPFHVANNPEFLKEGAAINDFMKPDRVVCGVEDAVAGEQLRMLYEPFVRQGNPIIVVDIRSSEMVKYASNAMLACKISFINEIANLCEHYGADVRAVREGMCADHRIGNQFLYPGLGYGGSCFPKDTLAVVGMGRAVGYECKLNAAVHEVNQDQRERFWRKISEHFIGDLTGRTLAFWGVAFKPETDDIREAPSLTLMKRALAAGACVRAFDPVASTNLRKVMPEVETPGDMYTTLDGCDALIVCTEWTEFRHPDFEQVARRLKRKVIFDGRNIYRHTTLRELGFTYLSVGRPTLSPNESLPA
ncbi:MAG TPA: UDP-glucose/GDP-mannose dehydrogenase family protein [Phycisphaerales bacterium]|nr:UDP-glucose/GDP-mannose dehydrogenase family protein [Phycisphaerales bacterium]